MRAGGVSEFSETDAKGRSLAIKLGAAPAGQSAKVAKPAAKAPGLTKADADMLNELGVSKEQLDEVIGRVS